jgi:hypothetical protein
MKLNDLLHQHTAAALQASKGDPALRRSVWAPFFETLHENKVVYRERFVCLGRIENLRITDTGIGGLIVPLRYLYIPQYIHSVPKTGWGFGGGWTEMRQAGSKIGCPYSGWAIWPEAARVRAVETLLLRGDVDGALELLDAP